VASHRRSKYDCESALSFTLGRALRPGGPGSRNQARDSTLTALRQAARVINLMIVVAFDNILLL
jgi:hypothetical protein